MSYNKNEILFTNHDMLFYTKFDITDIYYIFKTDIIEYFNNNRIIGIDIINDHNILNMFKCCIEYIIAYGVGEIYDQLQTHHEEFVFEHINDFILSTDMTSKDITSKVILERIDIHGGTPILNRIAYSLLGKMNNIGDMQVLDSCKLSKWDIHGEKDNIKQINVIVTHEDK